MRSATLVALVAGAIAGFIISLVHREYINPTSSLDITTKDTTAPYAVAGDLSDKVLSLRTSNIAANSVQHHCEPVDRTSAPEIRRLEKMWLQNTGDAMDRWIQYAEAFGRHFKKYILSSEPRTRPLKMLEIGIQNGGGWETWKSWLGSDLIYVGADVDTRCEVLRDEENNRFVEIGDQADEKFLQKLCTKYGPFDIIIDDGGHQCHQIMTSLNNLFNCMTETATYVIEDTHSIVLFNDKCLGGKPLHHHLADTYVSTMAYMNPKYASEIFQDNIASMHMYDSIVVIERAKLKQLTRVITGTQFRVTEQWGPGHMGVTEAGIGKMLPEEYLQKHPELTNPAVTLKEWW